MNSTEAARVAETERSRVAKTVADFIIFGLVFVRGGFTFRNTASLSGTRSTLLLLSPRRHHRLNEVVFGLGVRELLELFDLQAPVFVCNDVCDEDRFVEHLNSN
jgi:hypothetical protein